MPAFDELAPLDPVQADAGHRRLFTRRFDFTDMLSHLMLSFMRGGPPPVHEDKVLLGGDVHDLVPQIRRRLTPISDDLFHPLHPRLLRMHGRMIMVVISEVLMHNIEIAPHGFRASASKYLRTSALFSSTDIGRAPFLGNDGEISGSLANVYRVHPDEQVKPVQTCPPVSDPSRAIPDRAPIRLRPGLFVGARA